MPRPRREPPVFVGFMGGLVGRRSVDVGVDARYFSLDLFGLFCVAALRRAQLEVRSPVPCNEPGG